MTRPEKLTTQHTSSTQTTTTTTTTAHGYCCWHNGDAEDVRLIDVLETVSRGGAPALFACPPCRDRYRLVPLADR
ncbi:hypothetical protein ABT063_15615 [Streptomyces sp. NPDC002838]|uniref:hypothetical protein n=1 Tax=Streptomyces sp. NPDC002838 TaxID=3154436 RepID=UPI00331F4C75